MAAPFPGPLPDQTPRPPAFGFAVALQPRQVNYLVILAIGIGAFAVGRWTAPEPTPRLRRVLADPATTTTTATADQLLAAFNAGHESGYADGWEAMRLRAIEIAAVSAASVPSAPLVIERSDDEQAILRMQRERMEREECRERWRRMGTDPSIYCR